MFNFVDTYCAGLISTDALAALSLSFPVFFIILSAGSGLSQGGTALIANALGARDRASARTLIAQSITFAIMVGVVLGFVGHAASPALFRYLGAEGDYLRVALEYMNVIMYGAAFFILQMALNATLNAQGDTRVFRNVLVVGFFANCLLNPWLMYGWLGAPALGIAGIAWATVLVQVAGCAVLLRHVLRLELCQGLTFNDFVPHWPRMRQIAAQAGPAAMNMLTVALGIFVITKFVSAFSKEAVAGYGIATRIEQVLLLPTIGLNFAVLALVGQNNGAGRRDRVAEAWHTCIKYGLLMMLVGGVILFAVRHLAMTAFTTDAEVIARGSDYLGIAAITLCAYPILFQTVFMLQGLKRPAYGLAIGLWRQIIAPLLVFNLLAYTLGMGVWGIWWGICVVTWTASLFTLWYGRRVLRSA